MYAFDHSLYNAEDVREKQAGRLWVMCWGRGKSWASSRFSTFSTVRWQHEYFGDPSYGWLVLSFSTYNIIYLSQPDCHSQYYSCGV